MSELSKSILGTVLVILGFVVLLGIAGRMDADDEYQSFKQYCADVSDGVYPDYKKQLDYCER